MELRHQQVANDFLVAGAVLNTNSVARIADELRYTPVLTINALHAADRAGKIKYSHKRGTVHPAEDVEPASLSLSEGLVKAGEVDLREEIEQLVANLNGHESDITAEELMTWIPGSTDTQIKMLAYTSPKLAIYELTDPKDKDSTYTFLTLKENADKQFGKKQFKKKK